MKKMKLKVLFSLCLIISFQMLTVQPGQITGKVIDSQGGLLPGVTILIENTSIGTVTNSDGIYSIEVPENKKVLIFSFVGMKSERVEVDGKTVINVVLTEDYVGLEEVVAIGYSTVKKKDLTGSVTKIDAREFQKGFVTNAEQLIANKVPGVQITPISGKPGAGSSFLLRGGASLGASNSPLFVIDGVPIGLSDGPGVLSALNPEDISSFSVLKDASAAAIYGSRGSNGVIIITTKKGKSGRLRISFSSKVSVSSNIYKQSVLTGDQYREAAKLASEVSGAPISNFNLGTSNTDWQEEIFQNALTTDNSLSISGGLKNLPYRLSVGYLDQDGTLKTGNFKRTNVTLDLSPTFFDNHLKVNINLKGIIQNESIADESAIYTATTFDPTQSVRDENSIYGGYWQYYEFESNPAVLHGHNNPVSKLEQVDQQSTSYRSIGNIQLDYKLHFLPDLKLNLNTGYDIAKSKWSYYVPADNFAANIANGDDSKGDPNSETENVYAEFTLNYQKDIESLISRIDVLAGYSYNDFKTTNYFYPSYDVDGDVKPGSTPNFDFDIPQNTLISYFGRLIYTLNDRYVLTGSIRTDGSSRFSKNNRWGVFPSVSAAWKINEEAFLADSKVISNLKVRLGYGITGQQDGIGRYGYIPIYNLGASNVNYPIGNEFIQGIYPTATDRNRKWEQSTTSNIGLDWGLFNNKFSGSFDVYLRETNDLLNQVNIPSGTDFDDSIIKNIGSLENKGFEIKVNATPIVTKDFRWNFGFNYGYNENKITKLSTGDDSEVGLFSGSLLVNTVGYSRNTFYVYHQVYDVNGNPIEDQMVDRNNDGTINEKDRYRTKSSSPKHNLGFNTNLTYKRISLNMAFHSNLGQYVFYKPNDNLSWIYDGITRRNFNTSFYDTQFTQSGNSNQQYSDYYLQNASFLKMDNINLSYDFGNIFKTKNEMSNVVLAASVQNVFTITDFTGGDPESPWNYGVNAGGGYSTPRTYSVSLNFNF